RRDRLRRAATLCLAEAAGGEARVADFDFGGPLRADEGGGRGSAPDHPGRPDGTPMLDANSPDVLDREVVDALVELGGEDEPELFQELVELFLREAPPRLAELRRALDAGDAERLERVAHSLKSSSGNLGARQLAECCVAIERLGRVGDVEAARSLVERTAVEYERAREALEAYLS
ncbi:MAG TPA: Hpt domain-containing protein, partial [Planctomycetota bacterium]|nr:Hpt domain-containing protein [Planctomycetota bacterium]